MLLQKSRDMCGICNIQMHRTSGISAAGIYSLVEDFSSMLYHNMCYHDIDTTVLKHEAMYTKLVRNMHFLPLLLLMPNLSVC